MVSAYLALQFEASPAVMLYTSGGVILTFNIKPYLQAPLLPQHLSLL